MSQIWDSILFCFFDSKSSFVLTDEIIPNKCLWKMSLIFWQNNRNNFSTREQQKQNGKNIWGVEKYEMLIIKKFLINMFEDIKKKSTYIFYIIHKSGNLFFIIWFDSKIMKWWWSIYWFCIHLFLMFITKDFHFFQKKSSSVCNIHSFLLLVCFMNIQ